MAKTKSRQRRRGSVSSANPRSYTEIIQRDQSGSLAAQAPKQEEEASARAPAVAAVDWAGEYEQVFGDLRQLLIISVVLFGLMIVLGFLL